MKYSSFLVERFYTSRGQSGRTWHKLKPVNRKKITITERFNHDVDGNTTGYTYMNETLTLPKHWVRQRPRTSVQVKKPSPPRKKKPRHLSKSKKIVTPPDASQYRVTPAAASDESRQFQQWLMLKMREYNFVEEEEPSPEIQPNYWRDLERHLVRSPNEMTIDISRTFEGSNEYIATVVPLCHQKPEMEILLDYPEGTLDGPIKGYWIPPPPADERLKPLHEEYRLAIKAQIVSSLSKAHRARYDVRSTRSFFEDPTKLYWLAFNNIMTPMRRRVHLDSQRAYAGEPV